MSEAVEKLGSGREGPIAPRRRWSDAEKRRVVAESYQPGVSVSVVARRNDVNANLVWGPPMCARQPEAPGAISSFTSLNTGAGSSSPGSGPNDSASTRKAREAV